MHPVHARVVKALAPRLDMPPGLDVKHGVVFKTPAAKHISVEQARAATAVILGVAGEFVVAPGFVDRRRRVVVVGAVIHIVVKGTGAHYGTVVVLAQDHLAQCAHTVGGEAVLIKVTVRVIDVDPHQPAAGVPQTHADAITGGHRPVDGRAVFKLNSVPCPHRAGDQRNGNRQAGDLKTVPKTFIVIFIDHSASPD